MAAFISSGDFATVEEPSQGDTCSLSASHGILPGKKEGFPEKSAPRNVIFLAA
jgi:hypothetical protein